jgi:hypothetical protein
MKTLQEIRKVITEHKEALKNSFSVKDIGIFGSFVRGEEQHKSDIDILVDFEEPVGFFEFMDLQEFLEKILSSKVDLVSRKALKPHIGQRILEEVLYL